MDREAQARQAATNEINARDGILIFGAARIQMEATHFRRDLATRDVEISIAITPSGGGRWDLVSG